MCKRKPFFKLYKTSKHYKKNNFFIFYNKDNTKKFYLLINLFADNYHTTDVIITNAYLKNLITNETFIPLSKKFMEANPKIEKSIIRNLFSSNFYNSCIEIPADKCGDIFLLFELNHIPYEKKQKICLYYNIGNEQYFLKLKYNPMKAILRAIPFNS